MATLSGAWDGYNFGSSQPTLGVAREPIYSSGFSGVWTGKYSQTRTFEERGDAISLYNVTGLDSPQQQTIAPTTTVNMGVGSADFWLRVLSIAVGGTIVFLLFRKNG